MQPRFRCPRVLCGEERQCSVPPAAAAHHVGHAGGVGVQQRRSGARFPVCTRPRLSLQPRLRTAIALLLLLHPPAGGHEQPLGLRLRSYLLTQRLPLLLLHPPHPTKERATVGPAHPPSVPSRCCSCSLSPPLPGVPCVCRLLLPLPFFSFGAVEDRQLLSLQAGEASLTAAATASLRRHCLASFASRLRLSWSCSEASRLGAQRSGDLTLLPQLSLEQLAALLAPPVTFTCSLQSLGDEPAAQQATLSPARSSPSLPSSPTPTAASLTSPESSLPLVRTVSTVLMQEKLARSVSLTASASPLPTERVLSTPSQASVTSPSFLPFSSPQPLSGFGPHRVQVGSFVQLALDVACESAVLGPLRLRLHIQPEDSLSDGEAPTFSLSSSSPSSSSSSHSLHPPSPVITSGCLSPLLPWLSPHRSVRHVFALCCLAKGRFSYTIHCSTVEQEQTVTEEAGEGTAASLSSFARLRAVVRESSPMHSAVPARRRVQPLEVSAAAEAAPASGLTPHLFPCPHRLVVEAVV